MYLFNIIISYTIYKKFTPMAIDKDETVENRIAGIKFLEIG